MVAKCQDNMASRGLVDRTNCGCTVIRLDGTALDPTEAEHPDSINSARTVFNRKSHAKQYCRDSKLSFKDAHDGNSNYRFTHNNIV